MLQSCFRTTLTYLVLILAVRLLGKRQIGQMGPSEFVVTMLAANLAAIPIEEVGLPLTAGIVPLITLFGLELLLSGLSLGHLKLRRLLCGRPEILIEDGKILPENLRKTRVTLDELRARLREKDVLDIKNVQFAILETSGNLSVFPYPETRPASARDAGISVTPQDLPLTLISDGNILLENLFSLGKEQVWLLDALRRLDVLLSDTWLLVTDRSGTLLWIGKDGSLRSDA